MAGEAVAEATTEWDVMGEGAGAEDYLIVGTLHDFGYVDDVVCAVLAVGIGCEEAFEGGEIVEEVVDAGLEGAAFAKVDGVLEDVDAREGGELCEEGRVLGIAAVVDEDDCTEAAGCEIRYEGDELLPGLPSRDQDREVVQRWVGRLGLGIHLQIRL